MNRIEIYQSIFGPDFDKDYLNGVRFLQHTLFFDGLAYRLCDDKSLFACPAEQEMTRQFAFEAINLIKIAAYECQTRGGVLQICGSELDGLLSGNSPSIASARSNMRFHARYQKHPYNPFRNIPIWTTAQDFMRESFPGQGGFDLKIKGTLADYQRVCATLLAFSRFKEPIKVGFKYKEEKYHEAVRFIYPGIDTLHPYINCRLVQTHPPEKSSLPLLSLQLAIDDLYVVDEKVAKGMRQLILTTNKRVVAALNITPDTTETAANDNRDFHVCTNLDGLRGQVVLVHKYNHKPVRANDFDVDLSQTEIEIYLPSKPNAFEISAEAVELHRQAVESISPHAADNLLEILIRGLRKRHSYWPIPFPAESIARYQYLTELLWQHREDLTDQITRDKCTNELIAGLEMDQTTEFLNDLITTGLWRFLPEVAQAVINPKHIKRVIGLLKGELERTNHLCKVDAVVQIISELAGGVWYTASLADKREYLRL